MALATDFVNVADGDVRLLAGASAIDAADEAYTLPTDHHGTTRPLDGNGDGVAVSDIGAHELDPRR